MAKAKEKVKAWVPWEKNPDYPEKRGVCEFCKQRDDLKLAWDQQRYICKNAHACYLRWIKRDK